MPHVALVLLFKEVCPERLVVRRDQYLSSTIDALVSILTLCATSVDQEKKGLSHELARISKWTHFYRIALYAEPNFWLFFFF